MRILQQLVGQIGAFFSTGFGIFHPSDNPKLYPLFLALIVLVTIFSFMSSVVSCLRACFRAADSIGDFIRLFLVSFWRFLIYGLLFYIPVLLFWWSVSTTPDRLTFWTPTTGTSLLGVFDTDTLYKVASYVIHFVILFYTTQAIIAIYLQPRLIRLVENYMKARRPSDSQIVNFTAKLGGFVRFLYFFAFIVFVFLSNWSNIALAFSWTLFGLSLTNFVVLSLFGVSLADMLRHPFGKVRFASLISVSLYGAIFFYVWFVLNQDRSNPYLSLYVLLSLWATFDAILNALMGLVDPSRDTFYSTFRPVRLVIALPIITFATLLGASHSLPSLGVDPDLWLIAGAAGAAYALFAPLVDTVRRVETTQSGAQIEVSIFRRFMQNVVGRILKLGATVANWVIEFLYAPFESNNAVPRGRVIDQSGNEVTTNGTDDEEMSLLDEMKEATNDLIDIYTDLFAEGRSSAKALPAGNESSARRSPEAALRRFRALGFPSFWVFLITIFVYLFNTGGVYTPITLGSLRVGAVSLSWSVLPVVLSILNFVLGLGFPRAVKFFSGFLLVVTVLVLGLANSLTPQSGLSGSPYIYGPEFLGVFTLLLMIGHIAYLLKVLFLLLRGD